MCVCVCVCVCVTECTYNEAGCNDNIMHFMIVHAHVILDVYCLANEFREAEHSWRRKGAEPGRQLHVFSHLTCSSRSSKTFNFLSVPPFLLPCDSRHAKLARVRWSDA